VPSRGLTQVTGENGSGKSTLVELIAGYLTPFSGTVEVAGQPANHEAARRRRRICRTRPALFSRMTVQDHLTFASRCARTDPAAAFSRATHYGLGDWLAVDAGTLSTGNARKLWVIMCTLGQFDVAVLDEPYNGLDLAGIDVLNAELCAWAQTRSVVVVCHLPPHGLDPDQLIHLDRSHRKESHPMSDNQERP
jgi:ABC-2 type transport system ATP-binding protein